MEPIEDMNSKVIKSADDYTLQHYETERLLLRPTSKDDADLILKLFNTPKWLKNIGDRNVNNLAQARKYIEEKMLPQLYTHGYSNYTVIRKADNRKIGCCGLYDREGLEGIDIGFAFLPAYEGKGYAFESAKKVLKIAYRNFGIKRISAVTAKSNRDSQKLISKLGLTYQKMIFLPNDDEELMYFEADLNSEI